MNIIKSTTKLLALRNIGSYNFSKDTWKSRDEAEEKVYISRK